VPKRGNTVARNAAEWGRTPPLPATHYVDPLIYTSAEILVEERAKLFARSWLIACHESELAQRYDYRTYRHPAEKNLVIVRGDDDVVRAFYNVCSHRGNTIVYNPAGNAKHLLCIFHTFAFDCRGACVAIPREKAGYQDRLSKTDFGLRAVRTEIGFGGFVYVNLDDAAAPLGEFIGEALDDMLPSLETEPLEVFSFHRAIVPTNYKLWHDTNSEFYHDYMHYHNRQTSMMQPGYYDRRYTTFPNGHARVGDMVVKYEAYAGFKSRNLSFPGMPLNGWKMVDLFPGMTYNLRGSSLRVDTVIPISPLETAIEFRGLGLKRDTPQERASRMHDYNTIWGPFGRNLHEDLLGVLGQGRALERGQTYVVHGREEDATIHDEIGMRHFYAEWSRKMGRSSSDPFGARSTPDSIGVELEEVLA
jgi:methanesulfonate monooxygenase large subunit